ncbi:sigma-54-dependent transcriptional regulator [Photobacterium lipolyticum]|uniref:Sigma-54-dependent Fis family transcriptional regulator n=1 Tax=Photobacterium lipolyticum TaxID=266810 RepID=A0A2T3N0L2_9GAMM|nr:sigma-54 dependent transcriptional regulator [Photobacterium lipolyticum]PSW05743.1 sigma-54-dependent Fis family transcriptional regulator [Photobacterium lipolyticum]
MQQLPKVLLVEDTPMLAMTYQHYLKDEPIELLTVTTGKEAMATIDEFFPQLLLLDLKLPDMDGQEVLQWLSSEHPSVTVVVMTAHSSVNVAVDVMRLGAKDFLEKPFDAARLQTTVRNMLEQHRLQHIVQQLKTFERQKYHGFVGSSLVMQAVYRIIDAAASSKATVFITGESGTGKEVCAEAIHKQSPRKKKPFIALNCGAIPKDLMESEIFGHIKGAFTGAISERSGAASLADGGTLFLDEICEMDMELQTKLLRFVQTSCFQKVGSGKQEQVDIRFVCATNRDPLAEVAAGRFREDLYYRLHVVPIHLPPLRDRDEDIIEIAEHFLKNYAAEEGKQFNCFSAKVLARFLSYEWPGNIRQLQNVIRNILVLHEGVAVEPFQLPPPLDQVSDTSETLGRMQQRVDHSAQNTIEPKAERISADNLSVVLAARVMGEIRPLAQLEREIIEQAITLCDDNIPQAARYLDVSPSTIYRKKQTWENNA